MQFVSAILQSFLNYSVGPQKVVSKRIILNLYLGDLKSRLQSTFKYIFYLAHNILHACLIGSYIGPKGGFN